MGQIDIRMNITRIINSVFTSNTYVLTDRNTEGCWLIDIGDVEPLLETISDKKKINGIFLTHTHYDHIYGINRLIDLYPEVVVYTSEQGKQGLFSDKLNFSRYHNDPIIFLGRHISVLHEEDEIELFPEENLKIMETPGHDWSCLSYYSVAGSIFTGDSFIPGLKVITTFPHSDRREAELSVQRIKNIAEGWDVYPGHGEPFFNFHAYNY